MQKPAWWKNTYFWIALILFLVGVVGLAKGQDVIRDPGQKDENGLVLIYWGAAVVMLVNGVISHRNTVFHYQEWLEGQEDAQSTAPSAAATE